MKKNYLRLGLAAASLLAMGCSTTDGDGAYDGYYDMNYAAYSVDGMTGEMPEEKGDKFDDFKDNPFVKTADEPVSTFSVDADGASYAIMRRYLTDNYNVNPSSVRIEEFLNYFTFNYAAPTGNDHVAISAEVGDCPWNAGHKLLQLGIKGKELTADEMPRANFVFLVDVSGSMDSNDKIGLLKKGLTELLYQLNPDDRISLITYSGEVKKLLESTPVREADKIKKAISKLTADGCTAGGKALKMAYEEALANYDPKCNNRVIMGTDGDFNVGVTSTDALVEMVESYARQGIYMTCLGFGMGNLNDAMMEKVSNAGNGTYHYIDCENEMMKVFVHERSQFVSVANDAKCQVSFNPDLVSEYRLIGYENRVMSNDDFENDKKDAGEIGAGQTITALYEIVLNEDFYNAADFNPSAYPDLVTFDFRYKKTLDGASIPLQVKLSADKPLNKYGRPDDFYFAAGVAAYGMILRNSPYKGDATIEMAKRLVKQGLSFDPHGYRAELLQLMEK
ncbi:MAG: von Willebrand factor type A domain-containing protein [Prevotella sp.]|nr:von Willebrand factor type A domain-containing protein [Prevotella sp.]